MILESPSTRRGLILEPLPRSVRWLGKTRVLRMPNHLKIGAKQIEPCIGMVAKGDTDG